ncbi:hypothetical protein HDA32_005495 [Spinactinospora alkalitolerans]|uniref:DUF4352 domain-containing protein n=1 Tax=Spinactinospora alkalitolerans TaxID=687207 RepID=A0A852U4D6_9ACTN|nr:DUF4352 domain-containing protein [Spinactinospora alkalitolerans]NYE50375.1 hypothetical protein [Spinactinospora alkalitolerans]
MNYQPGYPQPAPKKSRGCLWASLITLGVCVLFGFVGCVAVVASIDSGSTDPGSSGSDTAAEGGASAGDGGDAEAGAEEEQAAAGIGDTVEDGKFAFTVTDVETGVESVGDGVLSETPQGQYVIVHVTVENIGDRAQMFDGSNQTLVDADDTEYSNDTGAEIYLGEDAESFLNEINPGNKVEAQVIYDVPADVQPDRIELHDSAFSDGVTVSLS